MGEKKNEERGGTERCRGRREGEQRDIEGGERGNREKEREEKGGTERCRGRREGEEREGEREKKVRADDVCGGQTDAPPHMRESSLS